MEEVKKEREKAETCKSTRHTNKLLFIIIILGIDVAFRVGVEASFTCFNLEIK